MEPKQNFTELELNLSLVESIQIPQVIEVQTPETTDNDTTSRNFSSYKLCGIPAFCDRELSEDEELRECGKTGTIGVFFVGFLVLALLIIVSNVLLLILSLKYPVMRGRPGCVKFSLAMADLLVGINLLCTMSSSYAKTINMTKEQLLNKTLESFNSPEAVITGGILVFSFQASILHLLFMSVERFFAIRYPIVHRTSRKVWIYVIIATVWILSIFLSVIPAAYPNHFRYSYVPMLFVFEMSPIQAKGNILGIHGPILFALGLIVPYILTIAFTALTGYSIRKQTNNFSRIRDSGKRITLQNRRKPEFEALKTTAILILTYTVVKVPIAVVFMLFHTEILNCQNFPTPYTVAFFITTSNSFLNVAIYSFRDRNFKSSFKRMITAGSSSSGKTNTRSTSAL